MNPNNGPFRTVQFTTIDERQCPKCKSVLVGISYKNDYVDDWCYQCPGCYHREF